MLSFGSSSDREQLLADGPPPGWYIGQGAKIIVPVVILVTSDTSNNSKSDNDDDDDGDSNMLVMVQGRLQALERRDDAAQRSLGFRA